MKAGTPDELKSHKAQPGMIQLVYARLRLWHVITTMKKEEAMQTLSEFSAKMYYLTEMVVKSYQNGRVLAKVTPHDLRSVVYSDLNHRFVKKYGIGLEPYAIEVQVE